MLKKYLYYFSICKKKGPPTIHQTSAQDSQPLLTGRVLQTCKLGSTEPSFIGNSVTPVCEMDVVCGLRQIIIS